MPIPVVCGGCQSRFNAPDQAAGRRTACPKCQQPLTIPAATASPLPTAVQVTPTKAVPPLAKAVAVPTATAVSSDSLPVVGSAAAPSAPALPVETPQKPRETLLVKIIGIVAFIAFMAWFVVPFYLERMAEVEQKAKTPNKRTSRFE
jgi:hypothetical protein